MRGCSSFEEMEKEESVDHENDIQLLIFFCELILGGWCLCFLYEFNSSVYLLDS